MNRKWIAQKPAEKGRPTWGFCRVQVETICRLWSAYRGKQIRRQDVQTWFAAHELVMRRCTLKAGRKPSFSKQELEPLTGLAAKDIRASIRRLEARGFLSWSEQELVLKDGSDNKHSGLAGPAAMIASITNHRRTLPIPRHTVLLLANTRRPVVMATVLGHLVRCMYYRSRECLSWGTCKSSWIAATFGVDVRNVKAARGELERIGWLRQVDSNHWHRQRYGGTFVIPLAWTVSRKARASRPVSPPLKPAFAPKSPPPESYRNLPSEIKNQKREENAAGVQGQETKTEPLLRHVLPVDLENPRRTMVLFQQAVSAGLVRDSIAGRLQFFAAAKRAGRLASNPGGFFVTVLKRQLWRNIAVCDEEQARSELARMPDFSLAANAPNVSMSKMVRPESKHHAGDLTDASTIRELVRLSLASVA